MILVLDTENTIHNKGSPFDQRNFNVCIAYKTPEESGVLFSQYEKIKELIEKASLIVFFNAKYDIHWLRKLNLDVRHKRIWCCQVFEFIHNRMREAYPSLDQTTEKYGLGKKIDIIEQEYWSKGINTDQIPKNILSDYALKDVELTYGVFLEQQKLQRPHQKTLFNIMMHDLIVLSDMEWNGSFYNLEKSKEKALEVEREINEIQTKLTLFHNVPNFNWGSNDHLSSLLYGGEIKEIIQVPDGTYKTGKKAGQIKLKREEKIHVLPRLYKPIKGSELKKPGKWSVEETYLLRLKGDRSLIDGILRIKELNKLKDTYYSGFVELHETMHWKPDILHTTFNMVVARTGRLSSTKPNIQNLPDLAQELFESRWTTTKTPIILC